MTLAETAARFRDRGLTGWDLAGPEEAYPDPELHGRAFEAARAVRRIADRVGVLPLRIGVNRGPVFAGDGRGRGHAVQGARSRRRPGPVRGADGA